MSRIARKKRPTLIWQTTLACIAPHPFFNFPAPNAVKQKRRSFFGGHCACLLRESVLWSKCRLPQTMSTLFLWAPATGPPPLSSCTTTTIPLFGIGTVPHPQKGKGKSSPPSPRIFSFPPPGEGEKRIRSHFKKLKAKGGRGKPKSKRSQYSGKTRDIIVAAKHEKTNPSPSSDGPGRARFSYLSGARMDLWRSVLFCHIPSGTEGAGV